MVVNWLVDRWVHGCVDWLLVVRWERVLETLTKEEQSLSPLRLSAEEIGIARESHTSNSRYVLWLAVSMTLLTLIWEVSVCSSILSV